VLRTVVPGSDDTPQPWRYTTSPPDSGWFDPGFDDSTWKHGDGGFGKPDTPRAHVGTVWETSDIWLRREFELPATKLVSPHLRIYHDEDADVYLNGKRVASLAGFTAGYRFVALDAVAVDALRQGANTLAVHVRQTRGGQFIDVGLVEVVDEN